MNTRLRRTAATLAAGLLVAGLVDVSMPASSSAADPPLKVVGTSDVSDSGLMAYLAPKILAATGVNVMYTGTATSTAINTAQQGGASALIVHAASLENQFVANNYSLEGPGRSLMWGDFILAGAQGDPAQVKPGADYSHDIVKAFHDVALKGANGGGTTLAHFISRAGGPGTTVQEHAIWKIVSDTYPGAIPMCTVSAANGGGMTPGVADGTVSGECGPNPVFPAWYSSGTRNQALNITFANACNFPSNNGTNDCYVFTDRGTFQNLDSTNAVPMLKIVARNNSASAPGGFEALVNAFHIYAINPDGVPPNSGIDTVQAKKFLDWMTSPAGQAAIGGYQATDPSFLPAASPVITVAQSVPGSTVGATPFTVAGHVANAIPGYPKLDSLPINLMAVPTSNPSAAPAVVASGSSDAIGNFALSYTPSTSMTYSLAVPASNRLEIASLNPQFRDLLTRVSRDLGVSSVGGSFNAKVSKNHKGRKLRVHGTLNPQVTGDGATVVLYRARKGKKNVLRPVASRPLTAGASAYSVKFAFKKGTWKYVLVYQNPGVITAVATAVRKVTIR